MKRLWDWYNEDEPAGSFSNKHIFWFAVGCLTGIVIKIIQEL